MNYENWKNKAQGFQTVDVRHIQGSFFEGLKKRAEALEVCLLYTSPSPRDTR